MKVEYGSALDLSPRLSSHEGREKALAPSESAASHTVPDTSILLLCCMGVYSTVHDNEQGEVHSMLPPPALTGKPDRHLLAAWPKMGMFRLFSEIIKTIH
jgi:hypothetical protein